LVCTAALLAGTLQAAEKANDGPRCPVSGGPISKDASVDHKGGKIYFCCKNCPARFSGNEAKYATKANQQLAQTGQAKQKACPLTGGKTKPATKTKVGGVEVEFCCNNCKGKVAKANDQERIELVFGEKGFAQGFTVKKEKD
jgi:YHS domain-containing protein